VQTLVPIDTAFQIPPNFFSSIKPLTQYCDSLVYNYAFGFNAVQIDESYGKGIGHVFYFKSDMGSSAPTSFYHSYGLFYFNKGGFPCGTPDLTTMDIDEITTRSGDWIVYPNPVSHTLRLLSHEICTSDVRFLLTDFSGRTVADLLLNAGMQFWTVDVSGLMPGNYLGRIVMGDGATQIVRVMKQ